MIATAVALHVAPALADVSGAGHDLIRGQAVITRLEHPLCADALDLQYYFDAAISGDAAMQLNVASCSPLHTRHKAVVIKVFPGRDIVVLRVYLGRRSVEGYMITTELRVSQLPARGIDRDVAADLACPVAIGKPSLN